jgi:hypothetical protein
LSPPSPIYIPILGHFPSLAATGTKTRKT